MTVEIRSAGKKYGAWTEAFVRTSLEESAGQFRLVLSSFDPETESPLDLNAQDECSIWVEGTKVITGIIERMTVRDSVDGTLCVVEGRSKAGQLADCSVATATGRFKRRTPLQIAQALAQPYGATVVLGSGVTLTRQVSTWTAKASETIHSAIERLTREDGLLVTDDAEGRVVLDRVPQSGAVSQVIRSGEAPVLWVESVVDVTDVFSAYHCRGQSYGTDNDSGEAVASPSGYAADPDVSLHRPTVIDADGATRAAQCQERARTEAAVRAGRSVPVRVRLQGWQWQDGTVVQKRQRVRVVSAKARLDGVFVVVDVDYSSSHGSGTVCDLLLLPPAAFTTDEIIAKPAVKRTTSKGTGKTTSAFEFASTVVQAASSATQILRSAVGMWK